LNFSIHVEGQKGGFFAIKWCFLEICVQIEYLSYKLLNDYQYNYTLLVIII